MGKYAGVVVLFNPNEEIFENIKSYYNFIDKLYIVDNSTSKKDYIVEEIKQYKKSKYISLGKNMGLAYALNIGCTEAYNDGYKFAFTMDQDSIFEEDGAKKLIDFLESSDEKYGIVCPNVRSIYYDELSKSNKVAYTLTKKGSIEYKNWVMTSGSLMDLFSFIKVGGFDNLMFIQHIDIDLGIKFHHINKKIIMIGDSILNQRFGNSKPKKLLFKTVHPSYAAPVRTYYIFRNQMYLEKIYGKEIKKFINVHLWKFVIKILLFEQQKIEKIKMAYIGFKDGTKGSMGNFEKKKTTNHNED